MVEHRGIKLWRRLPVGYKVILPFTALTLMVTLLASLLVSREVADTATNQVNALAVRDEDTLTASFLSFEQRQLTDLRAFVRTEGVAEAVSRRDSAALQSALYPEIVNQLPDSLYVSVLGLDAREILTLHADSSNAAICVCTSGRDLSSWAHVQDVLAGRQDPLGPKYAGLAEEGTPAGAPVFFTVAPVDLQGQLVGAIVTAEAVAPLVSDIGSATHMQLALYAPEGRLLTKTQQFPGDAPDLARSERAQVLAGHAQLGSPSSDATSDRLFSVPVTLRRATVGYATVVVPATAIGMAVADVLRIQLAIFIAALLLTVVVGLFVSRAIRRPLATLVADTGQIAQGRLEHRSPVDSGDEFGQLAQSFNFMTASLEANAQALEASTEAMVEALAAAIDARDAYTHGHSLRVAAFSLALGAAAGLDESALVAIRRGCLVHDIGKIGVPDDVLRKPAPLSREERLLMEEHPVIGHRMLSQLPWDARALDIVRHHHERWDGGGYPDGLIGDTIPWFARLVAVADAFDAMTSHRHYRSARSFEEAVREILLGSGSQFDPAIVALFTESRPAIREQFDAVKKNPAARRKNARREALVEAG